MPVYGTLGSYAPPSDRPMISLVVEERESLPQASLAGFAHDQVHGARNPD